MDQATCSITSRQNVCIPYLVASLLTFLLLDLGSLSTKDFNTGSSPHNIFVSGNILYAVFFDSGIPYANLPFFYSRLFRGILTLKLSRLGRMESDGPEKSSSASACG